MRPPHRKRFRLISNPALGLRMKIQKVKYMSQRKSLLTRWISNRRRHLHPLLMHSFIDEGMFNMLTFALQIVERSFDLATEYRPRWIVLDEKCSLTFTPPAAVRICTRRLDYPQPAMAITLRKPWLHSSREDRLYVAI